MNSLTNARAKIGDYSFTTVHPQVGVVEYEDFEQISIADFPGILPDITRGFGTKYLHHLNKCKIFLFVVDISENGQEEACTQFLKLKSILNNFDSNILANKPRIIIANKADNFASQTDLKKKLNEFKKNENIKNELVIPISAEKRINLIKFMKILRHLYEKFNKN